MAKRIIPGTKPPQWSAAALNAAIDMADRAEHFAPQGGPHDPPPPQFAPHLVTLCKNVTGGSLKERSIVGIKETAFDLPDMDSCAGDEATPAVLAGEPVDVELPDPETHTAGRWGVTLGPIGTGGTGYVVIGGLIKVRLYQQNRTDKFAKLVAGETDYLESAADGVPVVWRTFREEDEAAAAEYDPPPYTPTLQWALINLGSGSGSAPTFVAITEGFSGSTWDAEEAEDDNETITVYPFHPKESTPGKNTIAPEVSSEVIVGLPLETPVTVSSGKYKKGIVIAGVLMQVSCTERDLPPGWSS